MGPSGGYRLVLSGSIAVVVAALLPWETRPGLAFGTVMTGTAAAASVVALMVAGVLVWQAWSARHGPDDLAGTGRRWFVLASLVLALTFVRLVWVFDRVGPGTLVAVAGAGVAAYGAHLVWFAGAADTVGGSESHTSEPVENDLGQRS